MRNLKDALKEKIAVVMCDLFVEQAEKANMACEVGMLYEPQFPLELIKPNKALR